MADSINAPATRTSTAALFDYTYVSPEPPVIMLATKSHEILGLIRNYDRDSLHINFNLSSANELSLDIYREADGITEPLWDQIIDFKYILFRQGDSIGGKPYEEFFHIEVATDDASDTVKHITGTSACEFELSRRML